MKFEIKRPDSDQLLAAFITFLVGLGIVLLAIIPVEIVGIILSIVLISLILFGIYVVVLENLRDRDSQDHE